MDFTIYLINRMPRIERESIMLYALDNFLGAVDS